MVRILVLCPKAPFPTFDGGSLRMYNIAQLLKNKYEVHLLVIDRPTVSQKTIDHLEEEFNSVYLFEHKDFRFLLNLLSGLLKGDALQSHQHRFSDVEDWVSEHGHGFDLIYCNTVQTAWYGIQSLTPTVVDFTDSMSRNYATLGNASNGPKKFLYPLESKRLKRYEEKVSELAERSITITAQDQEFIVSGHKGRKISVIPNGVRDKLISYPPKKPQIFQPNHRNIVFVGSMSYLPNVDAAGYFAHEVLPKIQEEYQNTHFYIVGKDPSTKVKKLGKRKGVHVTGFVEEPADYMGHADVVVAPIRYGSGLQNKVLEGMGVGSPVVTTPLGREGIEARNGEELLVAGSSESFAITINSLLENKQKRRQIGHSARKLILDQYTWPSIWPDLREVVDSAIATK